MRLTSSTNAAIETVVVVRKNVTSFFPGHTFESCSKDDLKDEANDKTAAGIVKFKGFENGEVSF